MDYSVKNYIIKNDKGVYIRLNSNGCPITCSEKDRDLFELKKAKNILNGLPKTLQRLRFTIKLDSDNDPEDHIEKKKNDNFIINQNYKLPDSVILWVENFNRAQNIIQKAKNRKKDLIRELSNVDKEISDTLHIIELSESINMYKAWLIWQDIRRLRIKRRNIKDEIIIITYGLKSSTQNNSKINLDNIVEKLSNRKYKIRTTNTTE